MVKVDGGSNTFGLTPKYYGPVVWEIYSGSGRNATDVKGEVAVNMTCKNCREAVTQYGPETYHTKSTMIRCEGNQGYKAEV